VSTPRGQPQYSTRGPDRRAARATSELIEHVCGRHDAHQSVPIENGKRADLAGAHQVGGLAKRRLRLRANEARGHQLLDRASSAKRGTAPSTEVPLRHHSNEVRAIEDDEVSNPMTLHSRPCDIGRLLGLDCDHGGGHDLV
jgi:hypothetical protein